MREETQQHDTLRALADGLTHATGAPFPEAMEALRWVREYVRRCVQAGLDNDLMVAMERSGLGDLAEVLVGRR